MKLFYNEIIQNKNEVEFIVVGNKNDLYEQEEVDIKEGREFAEQIGGQFKSTSAKTGTGIDDMFEELAKKLTANRNKKAMYETNNKVIETSKLEQGVMQNKKADYEKQQQVDTCMC